MKEYICKEDLKKNFHNDLYHLYGWGWNFTDIDKTIDSTPTVTKADICREFAEILKVQLNPYSGNYGLGFCYEKMCKRFDELIAEMEQSSFKEYDTKEYADSHPDWAEKIKRLAEKEQVE